MLFENILLVLFSALIITGLAIVIVASCRILLSTFSAPAMALWKFMRDAFAAMKGVHFLYTTGRHSLLDALSYLGAFFEVAKLDPQGHAPVLEIARALVLFKNHFQASPERRRTIASPQYLHVKTAQERALFAQNNPVLFAEQIIALRNRFGYFFVNEQALTCLAVASHHNLLNSFVVGVLRLKEADGNWHDYDALIQTLYQPDAVIAPDFFEQRALEMLPANAGGGLISQGNARARVSVPVVTFKEGRQRNLLIKPFKRVSEQPFEGASFASVMQTLPENYRHNGGALVTAINEVLRDFESQAPQTQTDAFRRELYYIVRLLQSQPAHIIWMNDIAANASAGCANASRLGLSEIFAWVQVASEERVFDKMIACQYVKLVQIVRECAHSLHRERCIPGIYIPEVAGAMIYQSYLLLQRQNPNLQWLGLYPHATNMLSNWMAPFANMSTRSFMQTRVAKNLYKGFLEQLTRSSVEDLKEFFISCASVSAIVTYPQYLTECLAGAAAGKDIADIALNIVIGDSTLSSIFQGVPPHEAIALRDFLKEHVFVANLKEIFELRSREAGNSFSSVMQINAFLRCDERTFLAEAVALFSTQDAENVLYQCIRPDAVESITRYRQDIENNVRDLVHQTFTTNLHDESGPLASDAFRLR